MKRMSVGGLILLTLLACTRNTAPNKVAAAASPHPKLGVRTEEEWIVSEVARNIAVWRLGAPDTSVSVSLTRPGSGATGPVYQVHIGERASVLDFKEYIWSPETFAGLVPATTNTPTACDSSDILQRLLTPTVEEITKLDAEISAQLERDPRNPCLHEQAALLLGAFEMRDVWSEFLDQRPVLNRMAAHLAIARAERASTQPEAGARIAELMLLSLAWRHDGFLELLRESAATAREPEKTWLRVISLFAVQDWRELPNPTKATFAERTAYLLALSNKTDSAHVLDFLERGAPENVADWPRLAFERNASVETCNRFGQYGVGSALREAAEAYKLTVGKQAEGNELVQALNDEATDRHIGRIIGWPLWAGFEQRSLLTLLMKDEWCVTKMLGERSEGVQLRSSIESRFGTLRSYPLLLRYMAATSSEYERAVSGSARLARERPDIVNWCSWVHTSHPSSLGTPPGDFPAVHEWFSPRLPFGTAFDYNMRSAGSNGQMSLSPGVLEGVQKHVYHALARRFYGQAKYHDHHPPVAELKTLYGSLAEFDRDAMLAIAVASRDSDPSSFKSAAKAMCDLSVDDCTYSARYLREHDDPDEAARLYQHWADGAHDRVAVSIGVEWLVNYYLDHGNKPKAIALASMAANVYSGGGLETMARLQEKLGDLDEAEKYFSRSYERYGHPGSYVEFLVRQKATRFKTALDRVVAKEFPEGQQPFKNAGFGPARPRGAYIGWPPQASHEIGLAPGDVVVGIDGVRVETLNQLRVQRRLAANPKVTVAYWRGGVVAQATFKSEDVGYQGYAEDPPE